MFLSCPSTSTEQDLNAGKLKNKYLREKLKEWFEFEKDGELPPYAVYYILSAIKTEPALKEDPSFIQNLKEYLVQQNLKAAKETSIFAIKQDTIFD